MIEEYRKALRRGKRDLRRDTSAGVYPYLPALDAVLAPGDTVGEVRLGTMEIPLEKVVGTRTEGRQRSFSRTFMPVLAPTTEFAAKWSNLYAIQATEGLRDQVYEYMHRFCVQEGNKRISVMRYLGARPIEAEVVRLLPCQWDAPEHRLLDTPPSVVAERLGRLRSELALAGPREAVVLVSEPDAPSPPQPSYGWKEHLVNRRALRKSDGIASHEEGLLGAGQSYSQQW